MNEKNHKTKKIPLFELINNLKNNIFTFTAFGNKCLGTKEHIIKFCEFNKLDIDYWDYVNMECIIKEKK